MAYLVAQSTQMCLVEALYNGKQLVKRRLYGLKEIQVIQVGQMLLSLIHNGLTDHTFNYP